MVIENKKNKINITSLDNGAYWYFTRHYELGLTPNSKIFISTYDKFDTPNKLRLCWKIKQAGGWTHMDSSMNFKIK